MSSVFQIQPVDSTPNVISLTARAPRTTDARPVRARSLAAALAVGALIGVLFSLHAADDGSSVTSDVDPKTEIVAP